MKILGVSGSLRAGSFNTRLLRAAADCLETQRSLALYDIADIPFYNEDLEGSQRPPAVCAWLDAIETADALLLATPEYNHSIPGVLKNALDWASRPAFKSALVAKPTGILSAAMSAVGGARAQTHLRDVFASTLTPVYTVPDYLLPFAHNAFDESGQLRDEVAVRRLRRYMSGFAAWAARLNRSI